MRFERQWGPYDMSNISADNLFTENIPIVSENEIRDIGEDTESTEERITETK